MLSDQASIAPKGGYGFQARHLDFHPTHPWFFLSLEEQNLLQVYSMPPGAALSVRRDESFLLASSYGAVYGMLRHNGRRLYATNAVDGRDDVYDMSGEGPGRRVAMTEASTALNRRLIREQLEELAALNHYVQQP